MKILLVDDTKAMRNLQRGMLESMGFDQIQEATVGDDALSRIGAFRPDLLLVGWRMPDDRVLGFIRQYRDRGGAAPILMLSAESEKARVIEAIHAGVNNYMLLPCTAIELTRRIKDTLERASRFGTRPGEMAGPGAPGIRKRA